MRRPALGERQSVVFLALIPITAISSPSWGYCFSFSMFSFTPVEKTLDKSAFKSKPVVPLPTQTVGAFLAEVSSMLEGLKFSGGTVGLRCNPLCAVYTSGIHNVSIESSSFTLLSMAWWYRIILLKAEKGSVNARTHVIFLLLTPHPFPSISWNHNFTPALH